MYRMEGPKHAYISDLQAFWTPSRKQSLIVYQEQGRVDADVAVESVTGLIRDGLDGAEPIVLRCKHGYVPPVRGHTPTRPPGAD